MSIIFEELTDGELHEFTPKVDFAPVAGKAIEYVELAVQPELLPSESPLVNWVNIDPHDKSLAAYTVGAGWSALATRLSALANLYGLDVDVAQMNQRDQHDPEKVIKTSYIFQLKEIES